ncbi:MAG: EpsG family protein [Candidatus Hadarchaeum sp.]|uniref:hypothetical protein n=1 Tax=Candidatus Hadarchaeum sp. TaxID=2883567 RepID=UPI00317B8433
MQEALISLQQGAFEDKGNRKFITIVFAFAYAAVLTSLPLMQFKDRANYLTYASASLQILQRYAQQGWVVLLTNEPLWLLANIGLRQLLPPEGVLRAVIFLPALLFSLLMLRSNPRNFIWVILFLLVPQVLKNHITHLRQGFAIALFLTGWFSRRRACRLIFFSMAPFIHSSFFFVLGLMVLTSALRCLRLAAVLRIVTFAIAGVLVALGLPWMATHIGARQFQEYTFAPGDISGLGFLFWSSILLLMLLQPKRYLRQHVFELGTIVFYLSMYLFNEISARIFENILPLVLLAGLRLGEPNRRLFLTCILAYATLTWGQRLLGPGPAF